MKKQKIFIFMLLVGMALSALAAPAKSALGMAESLEEKARSGGVDRAKKIKQDAKEADLKKSIEVNQNKRNDLMSEASQFEDDFKKRIAAKKGKDAKKDAESEDAFAGVEHKEVKSLKEAAGKEDEAAAKAQYELGLCYEEGKYNIEPDLKQAYQWYLKAANASKGKQYDAMYKIGVFYTFGLGGCDQSYAMAIKWFKEAAKGNVKNAEGKAIEHPAASYALGIYYYYGRGVKQDKSKAETYFKTAVDGDYVEAKYKLGSYYLNEKWYWLESDRYRGRQDGFNLLEEAASRKHAAAAREIAWCYWQGLVRADNDAEAKDPKKTAEKWFLRASEYGDVVSQKFLVILYLEQKKYTEALGLLNKIVDSGDIWGETILGYCYEFGLGVEKDPGKALEYYQKAADKKYPKAIGFVGHCYYNGIGVKKDVAKAFEMLKVAGEAGDCDNAEDLGLCYHNGHGTKKDMKEAEKYLRIAADHNLASDESQFKLAEIYYKKRDYVNAAKFYPPMAKKGNIDAQFRLASSLYEIYDDNEALNWYNEVIKKGTKSGYYAACLNNIGLLYIRNCGVRRDYSKAANYFLKASRLGSSAADVNLAIAYLYGRGVKKSPYDAVQRLMRAARKRNTDAMYFLWACYTDGVGVGKNKHEANKWLYRAAKKGHKPTFAMAEARAAAGDIEAQKFLNEMGGYNEKGDSDF